MGKTYIDSVKYVIKCEFEIKGPVDKPDIIGAVFGQSEGLLGEELDLRELQQNGRIGRIEIDHKSSLGKTKGTMNVPSSLDMAETSILAAAIESVDKVGPFEAKFETKEIEDTRNLKRNEITERAKELLNSMMKSKMPTASTLTEKVREDARTADIVNYGPDKLPAGPEIFEEQEIIVVEGRADVLNLLRNGIKNAIAMGGAKPTNSLIDLCKKKTVTLFVDGDRGGELNQRKLASLTKIDFVARAPDGKEVEELARKEIIMALRKKAKFEAAEAKRLEDRRAPRFEGQRDRPRLSANFPRREHQVLFNGSEGRESRGENNFSHPGASRDRFGGENRREGNRFERPRFEQRDNRGFGGGFQKRFDSPRDGFRPEFRETRRNFEEIPQRPNFIEREPEQKMTPEQEKQYAPIMDKLRGSLKAKLFDQEMKEIAEIEVRQLLEDLKNYQPARTIVFDGIITKRLMDEAKKTGVSTIVGIKKGKIEKDPGINALAFGA